MYALIVGIIIVTAVLLILVVLAQNPKGGGLSSQFGGSGSSQLMGVKKTSDLLEKLTWGFAIALLVLSLSTNFFLGDPSDEMDVTSPNLESTQGAPSLSPTLGGATEDSGLEDLGLESDSAQ
ncbi:preprotein translocase subunit SecG [Marinoscillum sp. MHG1-6]|uniref:preprotein translocase subunit SecG n=1 Tax=Marinoscillum sp. MHG1-6 TaxID=2959627 RepID=UPI00215709C8|nr:preprotein translocase subunit SecG [Marinoscillum sp. MHG1-6]